MNETQFYTFAATGPITTLVIVKGGVLQTNSRLATMEATLCKRIDDVCDLLRAEIVELDSRLTRMEGRR